MKIKRILLVLLIAAIIFSSLSMVSAGLFDFLGVDSNVINGELVKSTAKWEMDYGYQDDYDSSSNFDINGNSFSTKGTLKIKLNNDSDNKLVETLKDGARLKDATFNISNKDLKQDSIFISYPGMNESGTDYVNYELDGDTLKFKLSNKFIYSGETPSSESGKLKIKSGNITIIPMDSYEPIGYIVFS